MGLAVIWLAWARKALAREVRTLADRLRARSRLQGFDRALPTLWIVARQAIYAITVMSQVRSIERLSLPRPYSHLMDALTAFAIDIDKYLGPLACFDLGYYQQLIFWTLLPPVLLIIAVSLTVASVSMHQVLAKHRLTSGSSARTSSEDHQDHLYRKLQEGPGRPCARRSTRSSPSARTRTTNHQFEETKVVTLEDALRKVVTGWVILCIYLHSFICGVIYKAFVCARPLLEKFLTSRGERAFLRADYGLVCGTQQHKAYVLYATLMLVVYATFPAILALRLYINRKGRQTGSLSRVHGVASAAGRLVPRMRRDVVSHGAKWCFVALFSEGRRRRPLRIMRGLRHFICGRHQLFATLCDRR